MIFAIALLALGPSDPGIDAEGWARKAKPITSCREAIECDAKWARGQEWIKHNSRFQIAVEKPALFSTFGAMYPSLDLAFVMTRSIDGQGKTTFSARAWCGNVFVCEPKPRDALAALARAMDG
ncbi:hypothetical protein [Sphingomonas bacterium]|uniref:hypothetical protein n=1 Tax=Sphingomonas bacterium TaxID=1895847 RepID=UPI001575CC63|nr:hypothetical protein [Sphingomonas bacterium]